MRVLVAGGAGYIGSNMTAMLVGTGHEPVVYDNLSKGHAEAVVERADLRFAKGAAFGYKQKVYADLKI